MAFSASKFNKTRLFNVNTEGMEYKSLEDMFEEYGDVVHTLRAVFIGTKGLYGDQPIFVTGSEMVNIPPHQLETAVNIREDKEAVEAINNGKVGFTVTKYLNNKYSKVCYDVVFVDI